MSKVADDKKKMQQKTRRPYKTPNLHAYGTVKGLTAGGSGVLAEGGKGGGPKTRHI